MAYNPLFGSKLREQVWQLECLAAHRAGRGQYPICVHCDLPVTPGQAWDRSHVTVPRVFGGKLVGVGHRRCNQRDNNLVVTPTAAKATRVHKQHVGITGPGLGRAPMRCGRRSLQSKTMRHGVQPRLSHAEKHAAFLAKRFGFNQPLPAKYRLPDALDDLTDGLLQGDVTEETFAHCAVTIGAPLEEIHDLIMLSRASAEMAGA
jgi:hypothetical protein